MADRRPVTQADYDQVRALHSGGLPRNEIARRINRSGKTVSRIAAELGLTFQRSGATAVATEARKADAAARRARLQVDALAAAEKLLGQMFAKTKVYNFGGKENSFNEREFAEPPFRDKRDIASALTSLAQTALKLAEYDREAQASGAEVDRWLDAMTGGGDDPAA